MILILPLIIMIMISWRKKNKLYQRIMKFWSKLNIRYGDGE